MGELIVNGIKWAFIIGISLTFMVALNSIIQLIGAFAFNNALGDVFAALSVILPFNVKSVILALVATLTAIVSFAVAKKIYYLTGEHIKI